MCMLHVHVHVRVDVQRERGLGAHALAHPTQGRAMARWSSTPLWPRRKASTAGCPQRSGGSRPVGSPFLWLLSFGEAKESDSPAGATSRLRPWNNSKVPNQAPGGPHPNPLPEGEGEGEGEGATPRPHSPRGREARPATEHRARMDPRLLTLYEQELRYFR